MGQYRNRQIHQIDPETGAVLRTIESNRFVTGVTWVDGELWHATSEGDESDLRRVDPQTGEILERLDMPQGMSVSGLESDGGDRFFCGGGSSGKVGPCAGQRKVPAATAAGRRRALLSRLVRSAYARRGLVHISAGNAAHKIALAKRHAEVAQNVVGGDDVEIEMRDRSAEPNSSSFDSKTRPPESDSSTLRFACSRQTPSAARLNASTSS